MSYRRDIQSSHTPRQINTAGRSLSKSHSEIWFLSVYWNQTRPDKTQTPGPDGVMLLEPDTAWGIIVSVSRIREKQHWGMSRGSFFSSWFQKYVSNQVKIECKVNITFSSFMKTRFEKLVSLEIMRLIAELGKLQIAVWCWLQITHWKL